MRTKCHMLFDISFEQIVLEQKLTALLVALLDILNWSMITRTLKWDFYRLMDDGVIKTDLLLWLLVYGLVT